MHCLESGGGLGLTVVAAFSSVNGYTIAPIASQFGPLFEVLEDGTAFPSAKEAAQYASELPPAD